MTSGSKDRLGNSFKSSNMKISTAEERLHDASTGIITLMHSKGFSPGI